MCIYREEESQQGAAEAEEEQDINLNDPEVANAATTIQAGFKGYKARKEVQELKVSIGFKGFLSLEHNILLHAPYYCLYEWHIHVSFKFSAIFVIQIDWETEVCLDK